MSSSVNGYTAPGQLKAQLLRHAQQIAASNGFVGFTLRDAHAQFELSGNSFSATALAHFYSAPEVSSIGAERVYKVGDRFRYESSEPPTSERSRFAVLEGSEPDRSNLSRVWIEPVMFDAVGLRGGGVFQRPSYYVLPGRQRVVAYLFFVRSFGLPAQGRSIEIDTDLEPGVSYRMNTDFDGTDFTIWIEDSATGRRVTRSLK